MNDLVKKVSAFGGLMAVVTAVISGGWQVAEMLHAGKEAYAQTQQLRDDVADLERRYNAHIEAAWKKFQVERGADPGERVFPEPESPVRGSADEPTREEEMGPPAPRRQ